MYKGVFAGRAIKSKTLKKSIGKGKNSDMEKYI